MAPEPWRSLPDVLHIEDNTLHRLLLLRSSPGLLFRNIYILIIHSSKLFPAKIQIIRVSANNISREPNRKK
jgi:hypothetical protein